jgi:hypothetical protein
VIVLAEGLSGVVTNEIGANNWSIFGAVVVGTLTILGAMFLLDLVVVPVRTTEARRLRNIHDGDIDRLKRTHAADLDRLRDTHSSELDRLQKESDEIQGRYDAHLAQIHPPVNLQLIFERFGGFHEFQAVGMDGPTGPTYTRGDVQVTMVSRCDGDLNLLFTLIGKVADDEIAITNKDWRRVYTGFSRYREDDGFLSNSKELRRGKVIEGVIPFLVPSGDCALTWGNAWSA